MLPAFYTDDGSGLPLLFIHAFPLNSSMWRAQRRDLSTFYRVLTFDLPGFGRGGEFPEGFTLDDAADMAIELLEDRGVDRAVICGCSMGGYIALNMLRRHPDRLSGLVLANTRATADTASASESRRAQAAAIRDGGVQELRDEMLGKLLGDTTVESAPDVVRCVEDILQHASAEGSAGMLEAMAQRPDSLNALSKTVLPVCVISGGEDALIPPVESEGMHAVLRNGELQVLPNAGHLSCLERPIRFNAAVRDFIQRYVLM